MILSFKDKLTEQIFNGESISKKIDHKLLKKARKKLDQLNYAPDKNSLRFPPSNALHQLEGVNPSRWAIRVDMQWRITFEWHKGDARNVCFEDYHK